MNTQAFDNIIDAQGHRTGVGGSDARLVLRVAKVGCEALSRTDTERLLTLAGMATQRHISTAAMEAGHEFETYVADFLNGKGMRYGRERKLTKDIGQRNFELMAHADFYFPNNSVWELKYSQQPTRRVLTSYMPQLQWYYFMGATEVTLVHGWGEVIPFRVESVEMVKVERDESVFAQFEKGITLIDKFLTELKKK